MSVRFTLAWAAAAAAFALTATGAEATVLDVSAASDNGVTTFLNAGTYSLSFIGTAAGGAYDGWNAWGASTGCDTSGAGCTKGWFDTVFADLGNGNHTYWQASAGSQPDYYNTPDLAAAAATGAPTYTFNLTQAQDVTFFIKDSYYQDNLGGVSLALNPVTAVPLSSSVTAVPEPASWAMMIVGLGGVGAFLRSARKGRAMTSFASRLPSSS